MSRLDEAHLDRIAPVLNRYVDNGTVSGVVTLIAHRGSVVHLNALGSMRMAASEPMREDAIFRIYSMTKPVVCTALMMLFEEGRFLLSDPVSRFLPEFRSLRVLETGGRVREAVGEPTIHHLLTHTSGLTYDFLGESPVSRLYRDARLMNDTSRTLEEMISELARIPLAFDPGSGWHYGLSIDVVARLIEVISGQPLAEFLDERLFRPLGMVDTGYRVPERDLDRIPTMYGLADISALGMSPEEMQRVNPSGETRTIDVGTTYPTASSTFARGGHGLFSTASDFLQFAQMLLNGGTFDGRRIIGRKTLELMHTNHLSRQMIPFAVGGVPVAGYGFGLGSRVLLNVAESGLPGSVGEFGWAGAARTHYWVDPVEDLVGILMTQYLRGTAPLAPTFQILAYSALVRDSS